MDSKMHHKNSRFGLDVQSQESSLGWPLALLGLSPLRRDSEAPLRHVQRKGHPGDPLHAFASQRVDTPAQGGISKTRFQFGNPFYQGDLETTTPKAFGYHVCFFWWHPSSCHLRFRVFFDPFFAEPRRVSPVDWLAPRSRRRCGQRRSP